MIGGKYVVAANGCWEWQRCRTEKGYGQLCIKQTKWRAHRYSWVLHHGPIPAGLFVLHRCDNPPCINPEHLFLGTAKDNSQDMARKGRTHTNRKLNDAQAREIRLRLSEGYRICAKLAREYGVSEGTIRRIRDNQDYARAQGINPGEDAL